VTQPFTIVRVCHWNIAPVEKKKLNLSGMKIAGLRFVAMAAKVVEFAFFLCF
jgi:hypothetical protein